MNLFPLGDRVVIEVDKTEAVTAGGIILPDQHTDRVAVNELLSVFVTMYVFVSLFLCVFLSL